MASKDDEPQSTKNGARGRDPQNRTEAQDRPVPHKPYAQMDPEEAKKAAPGKEEHDAAGQGVSG